MVMFIIPAQDFTSVRKSKRVTVNCSYLYNGGIVIKGVYYEGVECELPILSPGDRLKPLVEGMNLNAMPPTIGMVLIKP